MRIHQTKQCRGVCKDPATCMPTRTRGTERIVEWQGKVWKRGLLGEEAGAQGPTSQRAFAVLRECGLYQGTVGTH